MRRLVSIDLDITHLFLHSPCSANFTLIMKLIALILFYLLLGLSGYMTHSHFARLVGVNGNEGTMFGLWLLLVGHVLAAGLLTAQYVEEGTK